MFSQDLEATYTQAKAFAEIQLMKHTMTPKVPQLQNRTLSGNILDQSLGLLHDSTLDGSTTAAELLDQSDYPHFSMIGEEVSITQEESEGVVPEAADDNVEQTTEEVEGDGGADSEDTPGIGMEVVCVGGLEQDSENEKYTEMTHLASNTCYELRFPQKQCNNLVSKACVTPLPSLSDPSASPSAPTTAHISIHESLSSVSSSTVKKRGRPKVNSSILGLHTNNDVCLVDDSWGSPYSGLA